MAAVSWEQVGALRADFNARGVGILWDLRDRWFATTPAETLEAPTAEALRRTLRSRDGTTAADTQMLASVPGVSGTTGCSRQ